MTHHARPFYALALTALLLLTACAGRPAQPTLFDRLGGEAGIARVVGRTLERSATDVRTRRSFEGIKLAAIKQSLSQQICALSGGPCVYEGETMANSHRDAKIRDSEFDAMVAILREELDAADVNMTTKNDLLRLLAPMKRVIVTAR